MLILTGVFVISRMLEALLAAYHWDPVDNMFDSIVACDFWVSPNYVPHILGVYIRKDLIVTTFVPNYKYNSYHQANYHKLWTVNGSHTVSQSTEPTNILYNDKMIDYTNFDQTSYYYSPTMDLMFFRTSVQAKPGRKRTDKKSREPIFFPVAKKYAIEEPDNWSTAAFALTDKAHVLSSTKLVPVYYTEPVLVDCEEFFPKNWGIFICIKNLDHYPVIESGAPLYQNGYVFGIATFALKRGNDDIFVFTDLRQYRDIIYNTLPTYYY